VDVSCARAARARGRPTLRATARLHALNGRNSTRRADARNQAEIVISVIDQGSGMPVEVLEHVFEPFFTTKSEQGGSGLGLATLYSIVRKAGGHVEVEAEVGRGTRFDVVLPRCEA
jgi:signal transduction histidine kinase